MSMTEHTCHANFCTTPCKPSRLMCAKHWAMVPKPQQDRVYATYRPGQCDDMRPSPEEDKCPGCGTPIQPGPCAFDACPRREK